MAIELTKKERGFIKDYLDSGNGTQAALKNYDTTKEIVAANIASENLRKPKVRAMIEEAAEGASIRIVEMSKTAENETVRLNANKDILDRAGYKPIEKNVNLNVDLDIADTPDEVLRTVANKLEEIDLHSATSEEDHPGSDGETADPVGEEI